jgi:hypothetical protein
MTYADIRWFAGRRRRLKLVAASGVAVLTLAATLGSVPSALAEASDTPSACQAPSPGGPLFITATCVDPVLDRPYVDTEKPGTMTDPTTGITAGFLYVHGGFTGTSARFAFYFPVQGKYQGRFFETTYPTLSAEDAQPGCPEVGTSACSVVFAVSNGAYVVSTNNAGGVPAGGALAPYRANAAAAKFSRVVAERLYHTGASPRGYIYGASGGAYQVVGAMENTSGVWNGGVPMVFGVPNAIPSFMTAQSLAMRVLGDKLPEIADAVAPEGSGNPYAGLTAEQKSTLQEITRMGFPLRGWWQYAALSAQPGLSLFAVAPAIEGLDPSYLTDFWTAAGYEGSEPSVKAARIQYDTTVTGLVGSPATGLKLAHIPAGDLDYANLVIKSGPEAGQTVEIGNVTGDTLTFGPLASSSVTDKITPGTSVELDNSWLIALQYYQRHQVPAPDEYGWNQYRGPGGQPLEPQRSLLTGPLLDASTAGSVADGNFHGKMIMLESAMDVQAYPWSADWYSKQAQAALGSRYAGSYRLWYMDNADHGPNGPADANGSGNAGPGGTETSAADHIVAYTGEFQQALLGLDAWVAHGVQPPASTSYRIDGDDQVQLPSDAGQRGGVQPVATLSATAGPNLSSGQRIQVAVGQPVTFTVAAQTPPGTGNIVKAEWDFEGVGTFGLSTPLTHTGPAVNLTQSHTFTKPGTYFPVVRVTSQADGNPRTPYGLIQNLASVRVIVTP